MHIYHTNSVPINIVLGTVGDHEENAEDVRNAFQELGYDGLGGEVRRRNALV